MSVIKQMLNYYYNEQFTVNTVVKNSNTDLHFHNYFIHLRLSGNQSQYIFLIVLDTEAEVNQEISPS